MVLETPPDVGDHSADLQEVERPAPQDTPLLSASIPPAGQESEPAEPAATEQAPPVAPPPESQAPEATMSQAILEEYDYELPKRGDIRTGVVVSIQPTEMIVDIGAKRECVVAASDLQKLGGDAASRFQVGDQVSVYIIKPEDREGHLVGSLHLAELERDWARAEEIEKSGQVFEARVSGQNRGGLLVPFGRLRGFVPASHLVGVNTDATERSVSLGHWVGKTLPFKVIEVNRRRNRLILSYRAARRQWRSQQKRSLLEELRQGDVRRGVVSSLATFGAFVDLGGADGLIHVSELAWHRVGHPSEVVHMGQEVEVYVLRVDEARGRIGLSLKRLQPDPWTLVEEKYRPGQLVPGRICKLVDFGAFAELEPGIEGLIHTTELADPPPVRPEEIVEPGELHLLRVLRVDPVGRRIGLSLRAVDPAEAKAWQAQRAATPPPAPASEPADEAQPQTDAEPADDLTAGDLSDTMEDQA